MTATARRRTKDRVLASAKIAKRRGPLDCFEPFTEDELVGRPCYGGLDLALVTDCSALALLFPWGRVESTDEATGDEARVDELYRLIVRYWIPEETAKRLRDRVPYDHWASRGWITLTDGNEVDFGRIMDDVGELARKFEIREIRYDRAYATTVMQEIERHHGVPRAEFPQTMMAFTLPSKMFERGIAKRLIRHNGNPVMTWQIGHVKVKSDNNGNIRPVRPHKGDFRTIDGVVASIMALSGAMDRPRDSDWDGTIEYL